MSGIVVVVLTGLLATGIDLRAELQRYGMAPKDQGRRDTCTLFAITSLVEYELALQHPENAVSLSEEFLIWASNEATGLQRESAMFQEAIRGLRTYGVCAGELMPYSASSLVEPPSEAARKDAANRTEWKEVWIKLWDVTGGLTDEQMERVKQELAAGHPVAAGMRWPKAVRLSEEHVLNTPPPGEVYDGHTVLLVGYREDRSFPGGGVFVFRNSAGPGFGEGGGGYLTFEYASRYVNDVVGLRVGEPADPKRPPLSFEAESLRQIASERGEAMVQSMEPWGAGLWGDGKQLFFRAERNGSIDLEFVVPKTGRCRVELDATCAPDFGKVQTLVNGKKLGPVIDCYGGRVLPCGRRDLGSVSLRAGRRRIRFVSVGKNDRSSNFFFGVDAIRLIPER